MKTFNSSQDRRQFLTAMGLGGLFFTTRGAFAEALTLTPEQTIGPYYPDRMPLDLDNDLLVINDNIPREPRQFRTPLLNRQHRPGRRIGAGGAED